MTVPISVQLKGVAGKRRSLYTEGEVNKLIDSFLHPIVRQDPYFWVVNTVLHGLDEQDPEATVGKFMRYNPPKILKRSGKNPAPENTEKYPVQLLAHRGSPLLAHEHWVARKRALLRLRINPVRIRQKFDRSRFVRYVNRRASFGVGGK